MLLSIESAVGGGSISLISGAGGELAHWKAEADLARAENLLSFIDSLIRENSLSKDDITRIAVSAGPGSFTGIRIGLATAIGLAYGRNITLSSVSVLRAMAFSVHEQNVTSAVPMGRGSICTQTFEAGEPLSEPQTISESGFADLISSSAHLFAVPGELSPSIDGKCRIVDSKSSMATLIGEFCQAHPAFYEAPIFVSKSF